MKRTLIAALILWSAVAQAEVYRCSPTYPDKNVQNAQLTGADVMFGERPSDGPPYPDGWVTPDEVVAEEGMNLRYGLPEREQAWLICTYGARKRIKGRFHNGHEWGQHMQYGSGQPWFIKLPHKTTDCTVRIREVKTSSSNKSTWAVTATCQ